MHASKALTYFLSNILFQFRSDFLLNKPTSKSVKPKAAINLKYVFNFLKMLKSQEPRFTENIIYTYKIQWT